MPTNLSVGITELARSIRRQELSPVELVESYLSRVNRLNAELNAFLTVSADSARNAAKKSEREIREGKYRGPLHGIPIAIKDMVDTAGIRTTYGSAIFQNNVPENDATVVSRLKEAGAIILGKTNTDEFAFGVTTNNTHYGATNNPWSLDRTPGGSSGGSAVAVAASMCCGAVGTDTGGSVRIPSAFCGVVGLKPTYGRVSTAGVFPLAVGMDHVGPIARSVSDIMLMLQVMMGFDEADPRSLMASVPDLTEIDGTSIEDFRIATSPDLIPHAIDAQVESAYKMAVLKIENLGGEILERRIRTTPERIEQISSTILLAEAATQHVELLNKHSDKYGARILERLRTGGRLTTTEYITALRDSDVIRREIELTFRDSDLLLTPSIQILPPKAGIEKITLSSAELAVNSCLVRLTRLANITGIPAMVLPWGYSTDGLPLSIQLMGPKLCESNMLEFACALETATPELRNRAPPL